LDSSSIAAISKEIKNDESKLHFFSHALTIEQKKLFHPYEDESFLSHLMAKHLGDIPHHLITGEGMRGSLRPILDAIEITYTPLVQIFPAMSDLLLECAKSNNINLIMSGFGGDECVTFQAKTIRNEFLMEGRRKDLIEYLSYLYPNQKIRKYYILGKLYFNHKVSFFLTPLRKLINQKFNRFNEDHLTIVKPLSKSWKHSIRQLKKANFRKLGVREQQKERLLQDHIPYRLENTYHLAQSKGIEYAYPLLDIKLLQFVYSIPNELKNFHGQGRYLMRQALQGRVPDDIRLRDSKFGVTIPNIQYRLHIDIDQYKKLIEEGRQNNRFHYLDYDKLKSLLETLSRTTDLSKVPFGQRIFFSSFSILILQKWQREGKIDIGIKC